MILKFCFFTIFFGIRVQYSYFQNACRGMDQRPHPDNNTMLSQSVTSRQSYWSQYAVLPVT